MKKTMLVLLVACLLGVVVCGQAWTVPPATEGAKVAKYGRLAIVCAPGAGADPQYVAMVLREIDSTTPKYLSGLQKVRTIPDATVNATTDPPTAQFKDINDYDAVAVVTYTLGGSQVLLDINLLDARTGQKLWSVQLHAKQDNIEERLGKLAKLVPHRINKYFYLKG
jgi:hypothetical protein